MTLSAVQTAVYDTFGPLYAGQLADSGSLMMNQFVRNYRTEAGVGPLVMGRGVVKGTANVPSDPILTPYAVKGVLAASVDADFVGILVLNQATDSDANNEAVPVRTPTMVAVAERGSKAVIGAYVPAGITIAHGDPVYLSVSHASIPVGQFSNAAAAGLVLLTGPTWYGAAAAGTVGRISL